MKKKIVTLLLVGVLTIAVSACNTSKNTLSTGNNVEQSDDTAYQNILDDYTQKLKDATPDLIDELNTEAKEKTGDINSLSEILTNKTEQLAAINTEGIEKMATLMNEKGSDYKIYEKWSTKLNDIYTEQAKLISDAYMAAASTGLVSSSNAEEKPSTDKDAIDSKENNADSKEENVEQPKEDATDSKENDTDSKKDDVEEPKENNVNSKENDADSKEENVEQLKEITSTELFEQIYVPYAMREKSATFEAVSQYAQTLDYNVEIVEPTDDTIGTIKITDESGDYVYLGFNVVENLEIIYSVSYYCASTNSEVGRSNYSDSDAAQYDTFFTHVMGESNVNVNGIDEQRDFLFK